MTKVTFILIGFLFAFTLFSLPIRSQNAIDIINGAYLKCNKVQRGYLEGTRYLKSPTVRDTIELSYRCYFSRLASDSIYGRAFHSYISFLNGMDKGMEAEVVYTGQDLLYTMPYDSTAIIRSTNIWAEDLKKQNIQYRYFDPLLYYKSFPFLDVTGRLQNGSFLSYLGNESIHQNPCYHIQINCDTKNFPVFMGWKELSLVYDYWIRISDSLPVQYIVLSKHLCVNDTLSQFEKYSLNKYDLNQALNDSIFALESIPAFCKLRTYSTDGPKQLLAIDSIAPEWDLTSLNNEKISLGKYRGKVVLIDFFYQSCYPCRLAIPALTSLYTKYKEKGLVVIGIDPVDKRHTDNGLIAFLSKKQVNYPILFDDGDVARKYKVHAYPTFYLIDKRGRILFRFSGYGPVLDTQLEDLISNAL